MAAPPRLTHVFPTFVAGGSQVRATDLMNAFGARFEHEVVALDGHTQARERVGPDVRLACLEAPPKAGSLTVARRLRALLVERRPALLLTYNFGAVDALVAARGLGLAAVHHEDGFHADEARRLKRRRNWLRRLALGAATQLVVISRNLERIALEDWRQPRERVLYVPNGIDVASFARERAPTGLREELGIPTTALAVGSVGHLRPEKNLARLFEAAAIAVRGGCDLHLVVLGDGPERAALEERARAAPLAGRVHFLGFRSDPRPAYRALDAFALSSDTEQMPMALLEAMAAGLPCVSTEVGDVRAMLPEAQGEFLVAPDAHAAAGLAAALARLGTDSGLRERLGRANAARAAERFERGAMVATYAELYGRLAAR
ncbi:MAG TPA: glycosyltransferase [Planctomycetota bacterium]|nr:glycosyltransferase [Planctomycetota bacterium]